MDRLEILEQYIFDNDIEYNDVDINAKSMIAKDPKYGYVTIAINSEKIKSTAEKLLALTHERNHHRKNAYYRTDMFREEIDKIEYEINVDTVNELVPIARLKKILEFEVSRFELAELFGVPEDFVDMAMYVYQAKGRLPYYVENREVHISSAAEPVTVRPRNDDDWPDDVPIDKCQPRNIWDEPLLPSSAEVTISPNLYERTVLDWI